MKDGTKVNQMNRASNEKWKDLGPFDGISQAGGSCRGLLSQAQSQGLPFLSTPRDSFVGPPQPVEIEETPHDKDCVLGMALIKEHVSFRKELAMGTWFPLSLEKPDV